MLRNLPLKLYLTAIIDIFETSGAHNYSFEMLELCEYLCPGGSWLIKGGVFSV